MLNGELITEQELLEQGDESGYFNPCCCIPIDRSGKYISIVNLVLGPIVLILVGVPFGLHIAAGTDAFLLLIVMEGLALGMCIPCIASSISVLVIKRGTLWPFLFSAATLGTGVLVWISYGTICAILIASPPVPRPPMDPNQYEKYVDGLRLSLGLQLGLCILSVGLLSWFATTTTAVAAYIKRTGGLGSRSAVSFEPNDNDSRILEPYHRESVDTGEEDSPLFHDRSPYSPAIQDGQPPPYSSF